MINPSWRRWRVEDLAAPERWALNGGPFGSKLVSNMYTSTGVPVIRGCNLPNEARFDEKDFVYVSEQKADELRQHNARPGDLIITQRGTLGQVGLNPAKLALAKVRCISKPNEADSRSGEGGQVVFVLRPSFPDGSQTH
jgi:hypothetical protein